MTLRTTQCTVTFRHPFSLSVLDGPQPAGTYRLEIDEEEIPDISFRAFRRTATMLHTPAVLVPGSSGQVVAIDAEELAAALKADGDLPGNKSGG